MSGQELSGVGLAQVALRQAREAAKKNGGEVRTPRRRSQTVVRRDGREPSGFAAVLKGLMADRAWELPAAGGAVLDRWPDIAAAVSPRLPDRVQAVAFHPESGQLDLRPDSPAYATQLRLIAARIVARANSSAGTNAVRTIRVLAVGGSPVPRTTEPAPAVAAEPEAPVKTGDLVSEGYRQALAAHQSAAPSSRVDLGIAEAVERQTAAMRALSAQAFPETVPADQPAPLGAARVQRRKESELTRLAALRRARRERAGRTTEAAGLEQTA